jgi:hypothetical protein
MTYRRGVQKDFFGTLIALLNDSNIQKRQRDTAMNEFLLLALALVYVAICCPSLPIRLRDIWHRARDKRLPEQNP